jgi:ABC-type dipeptide/oligopeptide/nickel transport system permease component
MFLDWIKKIVGNTGSNLITSVSDAVDKFVTTTEEKEQLKQELIKISNEFEVKIKSLELENITDARDLQKVALQQDDKFSKRFIYYLTSFWSISAVSYLFFATYTKVVNERVMDTVLGFLLGTIIAAIINYFFGSSAGSKEKQSIISKIK